MPTLRRILIILASALLGLVLLLVGSLLLILGTEAGSSWALAQLIRQVNGLPGQHVTITNTEGTFLSGIRLGGLEYQGEQITVIVDEAGIRWNPVALLSARLSIPEILLDNAEIDLFSAPAPEDNSNQTTGPLLNFAPLPVDIDLASVSIRQLEIRQSQQQFTVDEFSLSAYLQDQSLEIDYFHLNSDSVQLEGDMALMLTGNLPLSAGLQWEYTGSLYPDSGPSSGTLQLSGDLASLQIQHQLQQPLQLSTQGMLDTGLAGTELNIELTHLGDGIVVPQTAIDNLVLNNFALTTRGNPDSLQVAMELTANGGPVPTTTVNLNLTWQGDTLAIEDLQLVTASGRLMSSGELELGSAISGSLRYRLDDASPLAYLDNELPLQIFDLSSSGVLQFSVAESTLQGSLQLLELSGEFGDYPFRGQGEFQYGNDVLRFDGVRLSTSANELTVSGVVGEEVELSWQIAAPQLNQFIENLNGDLQANGRISGNPANPELEADITAESLSYDALSIGNLKVRLQRQEQSVSGLIELTDASFNREDGAANIQSLALELSGTEPQHRLTLDALTDYGEINLELQGGITAGGFNEPTTMNWEGLLRRGTLRTEFGQWQTTTDSSIVFNSSAFELASSCWLQFDSSLCLDVSAAIEAENSTLQLASQLNNYPLSVFNHPANQADGTIPRPSILPGLPEMVSLAGTANAELNLTVGAGEEAAISFNLEPDDFFLTVRSIQSENLEVAENDQLPEEQRYSMENARLTASLENGSWIFQAGTQITGLVVAGETNPLSSTLESEIQLSPEGELSGELQTDFGDIGWLSAFSQDLEAVEGTLSGNIGVSGTPGDPRFSINMQLLNGQVSVPPLGITIDRISSDVSSLGDGSIQVSSSAYSGNGTLRLQGLLSDPFTTQRSLRAQVQGTEFTLADIPDLNLVVTPDVTINADGTRIALEGSLELSTLVVNLVELPAQAVDVSRDVVIVNYPEDQPQLARSIASEQSTVFNLPVVADVDINLGEQVRFNGFGLTTELAGTLNVRQQENGTNLTYGELEIVSGQYALYGRSLQIRQGKLLFFGAYDNPALDIRATREVESATVGVLMNGTLKNIQSNLFSTPALPDSDIIAIIVTGKPFSEIGQQESGSVVDAIANLGLSRSQGLTNQVREQLGLDTLAITNTGNIDNSILTIGKYLTPDLFIRYGVGLFDHQTKLAVDYSLSERITLQAETGEYQSVDVIYRVER